MNYAEAITHIESVIDTIGHPLLFLATERRLERYKKIVDNPGALEMLSLDMTLKERVKIEIELTL